MIAATLAWIALLQAPAPADATGADRAASAAAETAAPKPRIDFRAAVRAGAEALAADNPEAAAAAYEAALEVRPDSAEASYNLGVALYRAGRFKDAEGAFRRAGERASGGEDADAALAASSLYNRAASFYGATRAQAEAAQRMLDRSQAPAAPEPAAEPIDTAALTQAIADAVRSFEGFRDAATADPRDPSPRANAEQSLRLVRALEQLRKQQQEQQEQQENQKQDQQQPKDQRDSDDRKPQDQQATPDQPPAQDQPGPQGQAQPKDQPPKDQPRDQPKPGAPEATPEAENPPAKDAPPAPKDGEMTKEQADRLLQAVRDRERARRAAQERKADTARGRSKPAKDW